MTPHLIDPEWKAAMFAAWRNNDQVEMARLNAIHESCRECGSPLLTDVHTHDAAEHGREWHLFVYANGDRHTGKIAV